MSKRTVLVTGGARGIGKGIARSFLGAGCNVMIADLAHGDGWRYRLATDAEMAEATTDLADLGDVRYTPVDVTNAASCAAAVQATLDAFGSLDVLVNNAGVVDSGSIDEFTEAQWERIFAVNVKGIFLMTQAALAGLRASADAAIVNTASIAGKRGAPAWRPIAAPSSQWWASRSRSRWNSPAMASASTRYVPAWWRRPCGKTT